MSAIIELSGVRKFLGNEQRGFELRIPELVINRGQFVAITGKSGSGKSTLLDLLALIARPSAARVFNFHGREPSTAPVDLSALWEQSDEKAIARLRRLNMGYVLQTGALLKFVNVRQNVLLPLRMAGHRQNRRMTTYVERALEMFDIPQSKTQDTRSLSGGERQRVAILRAILHRPDVVFCDEPTAALDFEMAQTVLKQLQLLAERFGITIVMVTHDVDLVAPFATQRVQFHADEAASGSDVRVYVARETAL